MMLTLLLVFDTHDQEPAGCWQSLIGGPCISGGRHCLSPVQAQSCSVPS